MVCAAAENYNITLLPGDGIGPEIMKVAKEVLVGPQSTSNNFTEALVGGAAIDAHGVPLPPRPSPPAGPPTRPPGVGLQVGHLPAEQRPEQGLLGLRAGLGVFANLRPANILPQLIDASSSSEVVGGTDIMVVRELLGGITSASPRASARTRTVNGFNTAGLFRPRD